MSRVSEGPFIGHVHLKVTDLERSVAFYELALGMTVMQRMGASAAFLSYNGYHHHLGLNTWHSLNGEPANPRSAGLYHFAVLFLTRRDLAIATKRALDAGVRLDGVADHGVSEAIYFRDPDGNGIELYWDKPEAEWPHKGDQLAMVTDPLDIDALLREADAPTES